MVGYGSAALFILSRCSRDQRCWRWCSCRWLTADYAAAFLSSVAYGYIVKSCGYNAPFIPMIVLMTIAALLWLKVDPERQVVADSAVRFAYTVTLN